MKKTPLETPKTPTQQARSAGDTLCKRLAEEHPEQFAKWLFGANGKVKVDKTEMSCEPIRADSVIFSHAESETLHAEFQTTMKSDVPVPLRMLDYYVGLKRQNPKRRVRQVLVVLKQTGEKVPDRYQDERTLHIYDVVKVWERDPAELLKHEGLLPLATLCHAESGEKLLGAVAAGINRIKSRERRREALTWSRMLAGLRYDKDLIIKVLKESDMLEESVIYQDILQRGAEREVRKVALRLLEIKVGKLPQTLRRQIERLATEQLEALCEALIGFHKKDDLTRWLEQRSLAGD